MPRGVTKRRPATVTSLLDAAMVLFAEQGFGATSIPEICARAGLTKGAFDSNFPNKDALFLALLDRSWERRAALIRETMPVATSSPSLSTADPRRPPFRRIVEWTLVSTEFTLHAIRHPEVAAVLVEHEARARSELAALIAEALDHARRFPTVPVIELARMLVAVTEGSDLQALTDVPVGTAAPSESGRLAVAGLLRQFSTPVEEGADQS